MIGSHLRQQLLQCRQFRFRSFSLLHCAGSQDACPKFPWHVYPLSSHGKRRRNSGEIMYLSVWKRSASTVNASSVETETEEHLWKEYFADASQWWDNRLDKKSSRSPDLKHKVTKKALWIDRQSTPEWVKARLASVVPQGSLQCHATPDTKRRYATFAKDVQLLFVLNMNSGH